MEEAVEVFVSLLFLKALCNDFIIISSLQIKMFGLNKPNYGGFLLSRQSSHMTRSGSGSVAVAARGAARYVAGAALGHDPLVRRLRGRLRG